MKKITFMGIKRLCKLRNCAKAMEKASGLKKKS